MVKKKKSVFGRINAWLHLWLGIFAGIILVFVALTGTVIVFCDEIIDLSGGNAKYVAQVKPVRLPAEQLISGVKKAFPKRKNPAEITFFKDPKRTVRFRTFDKKKGLSMVYVDPYTGKILKDDNTANFFYIVAHLHASFLWHGPGTWIVDVATVIFLIELISGIILWWPKKWNRHTRDVSFTIKWKARFKRVNYDLHNVLGFYSSLLAIILTVTGLVIAFEPVAKATAAAFGGDATTKWQKKLPKADSTKMAIPVNQLFEESFRQYPDKKVCQMYTFKIDSAGYYMFTTAQKLGLKSAQSPVITILDKYSGKPIAIPSKSMKGEYIENAVWQLHMGTWMGVLGKVCTFICGLIATSLPITGFIIWWGKGKKKAKNKAITA